MSVHRHVAKHYRRQGLPQAILDALEQTEGTDEAPAHEILAPVDEFHFRGRIATRELADLADIGPDSRVLDLGCGLGGPCRFLAAEYGARVTGVDLTPEFCETATMLTEHTELTHLVDFHCADAADTGLEASSYDIVWTQHMSMNVADKDALYAEVARLLRPGGRLAAYEILSDCVDEIELPVPWAREQATNYVASAEALRTSLAAAGLQEARWRDTTDAANEWFAETVETLEREGPSPLGLHIVLGPDTPTMFENLGKNLEAERLEIIQTIYEKPAE